MEKGGLQDWIMKKKKLGCPVTSKEAEPIIKFLKEGKAKYQKSWLVNSTKHLKNKKQTRNTNSVQIFTKVLKRSEHFQTHSARPEFPGIKARQKY